jgi:hypothetical protein
MGVEMEMRSRAIQSLNREERTGSGDSRRDWSSDEDPLDA